MKYISSVLKPELVAAGKLALLGCTVALFSACGGGGGSSTPVVPAPVVPAPVAVIDPLAPVEPVDFALVRRAHRAARAVHNDVDSDACLTNSSKS